MLQLGRVADGQGRGRVPEPQVQGSRRRNELEELNTSDFKLEVAVWLFHPRYLGNVQDPVELVGTVAGQQLLE